MMKMARLLAPKVNTEKYRKANLRLSFSCNLPTGPQNPPNPAAPARFQRDLFRAFAEDVHAFDNE